MSATKSRLNISLADDMKTALISLAKRDDMPTATKAERLLEVALELEEDQLWDQIAAKRDKKDIRFISHIQAFDV